KLRDLFFLSSRRRHTRFSRDWSSDVCSSDLIMACGPADQPEESSAAESLPETNRLMLTDAQLQNSSLERASLEKQRVSGTLQLRSEERRVGQKSTTH